MARSKLKPSLACRQKLGTEDMVLQSLAVLNAAFDLMILDSGILEPQSRVQAELFGARCPFGHPSSPVMILVTVFVHKDHVAP